MCGRFVRISPIPVVARHFKVQEVQTDLNPSYNISPSQEIVTVNYQGVRQLMQCRWGFVPSWAKDPAIGDTMINARAETVAEKPAFREAFRKYRCLIVADGFFEWQKIGNHKYPVYMRLKSGEPFAFAGLYSSWTSPGGERTYTCTIITTEANEMVMMVHPRMPVILPPKEEDLWLDPSVTDRPALLDLLKPYDAHKMESYIVNRKMNSPFFNSPDNLLPVERPSQG